MEDQTNNRIREEFNKKFCDYYYPCDKDGNGVIKKETRSKDIAEWWLSRIDELLKSQREELVKKIEKHQNFITMSDYDVGYNDCKENIINLIKNN